MEGSLLQSIHDVGEELSSALEKADLKHFLVLLEKRGTLLERMIEYEHPSEVDPDWRSLAPALITQHERLTAALDTEERRMQDMLAELERFKGASRSYQRTTPGSQILNKDLRI